MGEQGQAVGLRVRRSAYAVFRYADDPKLDVVALLHGDLRTRAVPTLLAGSCLTGNERALDDDEQAVLAKVSATEWSSAGELGVSDGVLEALLRDGLLIADSDDAELARLRGLEERLVAARWTPRAAAYHFLTRRRDVDLGIRPEALAGAPSLDEAVGTVLAAEGPPPNAFDSAPSDRRVALPLGPRDGDLYEILLRRRTTRAFDTDRELPLEDFATVLRYVFGAHGYEGAGELLMLSKTSPSGGGMHPIEAYPLVVRVDGLEPGVYHYDTAAHSLALIEELDRATAEQHVDEFTCGQFWFRDAQALVVLAARFPRSFWKYRDDDRAYSVLLMDAGHLSQTFYLVCTELGLGAFVTAFVNDRNIEERLGLDPATHGVLAVIGCGLASGVPSAFDPEIVPYVPRETTI